VIKKEHLTVEKIQKAKRMLEKADRKRPRVYIDGKEYIYFSNKNNK